MDICLIMITVQVHEGCKLRAMAADAHIAAPRCHHASHDVVDSTTHGPTVDPEPLGASVTATGMMRRGASGGRSRGSRRRGDCFATSTAPLLQMPLLPHMQPTRLPPGLIAPGRGLSGRERRGELAQETTAGRGGARFFSAAGFFVLGLAGFRCRGEGRRSSGRSNNALIDPSKVPSVPLWLSSSDVFGLRAVTQTKGS